MSEEMRQIEFVVEPFVMLGVDRFYSGDRKTFPKADADRYIQLGWAKDPVTGEQGELKPGAAPLEVHTLTQQA